jgi:hypothetical protein
MKQMLASELEKASEGGVEPEALFKVLLLIENTPNFLQLQIWRELCGHHALITSLCRPIGKSLRISKMPEPSTPIRSAW